MSFISNLDRRLRDAYQRLRRVGGPAQKLLARAQHLFMPAAIGFVAYVAWSSRDLLGDVLVDADLWLLVATVAVWSVLHFITPWFDRQILAALGDRTGYGTLRDIYLARLPTKYLPGGVWHNVTRLIDLNRTEIDRSHLTTLAVLQISVPLSVAFAAGGSLVFVTQQAGRWEALGAISAVIGLLVAGITPYVLNRTILREGRPMAASGYVRGVTVTAIFWAIAATAFFMYLSAYSILATATSWWEIAGSYLVAWGTGFISVFTPQGFGVFEATAAGLIAATVDFQVLLAVIAGFRIVILLSDGAVYLVYRAAHRWIAPRTRHAAAR